MDVGLECLQPFLVADPKVLLLVDDHKAEPLELDALGEDRVGADDDVDRPVGDAFLGLLRLGGGDQAREAADVEREALEPLDEVLVMLAGKQGGRADQGDLAS